MESAALELEITEEDSMTKHGNTTAAIDLGRSAAALGDEQELPVDGAVAVDPAPVERNAAS